MSHTRDYLDYLHENVSIAPAGTQEELEASQLVQQLMEEHRLDVSMEEFTTSTRGQILHDSLYITLFFGVILAGFVGSIVSVIGVLVATASAIILFLEAQGRPIVSNLGPRATSQNVIGVHRASGPLVTRGIRPIVIVAHVDSPNEGLLYNSTFARFQALIRQISIPCIGIAFVAGILQLFTFIPALLLHILWFIGILSGLPLVLRAVATIYDTTTNATMGANDNKSGLAALLGIMDMVHPGTDRAKEYLAAHPHSVPTVFEEEEPLEEETYVEEDKPSYVEETPAVTQVDRPEANEADPVETEANQTEDTIEEAESVSIPADESVANIPEIEPEVAPAAESAVSTPIAAAELPNVSLEGDEELVPQFIYHGDTDMSGAGSIRRGSDFLQSLGILPQECEIVYDKPELPEVEVVLPELKLPEIETPASVASAPAEAVEPIEPAAVADAVTVGAPIEEEEQTAPEIPDFLQNPVPRVSTESPTPDVYEEEELPEINPYLRTKFELTAVDADFVELQEDEESELPFVKTRFDKFLDLFKGHKKKEEPKAEEIEEPEKIEPSSVTLVERTSEKETLKEATEPAYDGVTKSEVLEETEPEDAADETTEFSAEKTEIVDASVVEVETADIGTEDVIATETTAAPAVEKVTEDADEQVTNEKPRSIEDTTGIYTTEPELTEEELNAKDSTGMHILDPETTSRLKGSDVAANPEPVEDPKWGTAEFKPEALTNEFARRAMLFDLPDPLEKGNDPLQQSLPSKSGRLQVIEGKKDDSHTSRTGRTGSSRVVRTSASDTTMGAPTPVKVSKNDSGNGAHKPEAIGFISRATSAQTSAHNTHSKHERKEKTEKKGLFPRIFGRRKDDQESMGQWLGVEDDFDAKSNGAEIGNWDNFNEESTEKDSGKWKGGATSTKDAQNHQGQAVGYELGNAPTIEDGFVENQKQHVESQLADALEEELQNATPEADSMSEEDREELRASILGMGDDALIAHDIWFVATGASNYNNAGIKDFLANHRRDVRGAFVINLENIGAGYLTMLTKEGEVNTKNIDRRIARLLQRTAKDLHIDLNTESFAWNQTDATACMQANMRSATIIGLSDDGVPALSHTAMDIEQNIDPAQVVRVADLIAEFIRRS